MAPAQSSCSRIFSRQGAPAGYLEAGAPDAGRCPQNLPKPLQPWILQGRLTTLLYLLSSETPLGTTEVLPRTSEREQEKGCK